VAGSSINTFKFEIGGCFDGTEFVELNDGGFIHGLSMGSYGHESELKTIMPTSKEWNDFECVLEHLKVWRWKKEYVDPDVLDGTQWSLQITKGASMLKCHGSNDYPSEFDAFVAAVNKLAQSDLFGR